MEGKKVVTIIVQKKVGGAGHSMTKNVAVVTTGRCVWVNVSSQVWTEKRGHSHLTFKPGPFLLVEWTPLSDQ